MARILGAAEFKATCLRIIKQMGRDGEPVTITNRGRGSVLSYDSPFLPAADPSDWTSAR